MWAHRAIDLCADFGIAMAQAQTRSNRLRDGMARISARSTASASTKANAAGSGPTTRDAMKSTSRSMSPIATMRPAIERGRGNAGTVIGETTLEHAIVTP